MNLKSHYWWDLTTREFSELDMERIVAVLPVGAVEQHGPHLPVKVDAAINAGIVNAAVARMQPDFPALILPSLPIGKSNEHAAFPGTITLSYETLARVWHEVGESVHRTGCRKLILFNSHGGQPQIMDIVCRELRVKLEMFVVSCSWFHMTDTSDLFSAHEREFGIHGGESETSLMLHLDANRVEMIWAENFEPTSVALARDYRRLTPEGAIGFGWQAQDLHEAGACGNAAAADATRGASTLERAATALIELIDEVARFPLSAIRSGTRYSSAVQKGA